ncbi:MAG: prepilin-type N-terminal cleavage/methylation domain-containing protein [Sulfurovum sp.]|nr:prepilin-type N-terminal cleavage/methylation domain-containing protein [Sulfurovum sp.]
MSSTSRNGFTMIELIFVIVVIGILAAIAVPKFALTRSDAIMAKAKATVSSVRSSVATERQKRILRGSFTTISKLGVTEGIGNDVFNGFDGNTSNPVLEYGSLTCATASSTSCWYKSTAGAGTTASPTKYTFKLPTTGGVVFLLQDNRFVCEDTSDPYCIQLTR